jgi:uncharacterized protein YbaR (Trm112 family)
MIDPELLKILVCPEDRTPVALADETLVQKVNSAIAAGRVKNRKGAKMESAIDGGLVRKDGTCMYPIINGLPMMVIGEAIALGEL